MHCLILHSDIAAPNSDKFRLDEQDTLDQVAAITKGLLDLGFKVSSLAFTMDFVNLAQKLRQLNPDVVFNLVESVNGCNEGLHYAPMLMNYLNIPCTGNGAQAMEISTHKLLTKQILSLSKLPTPAWLDPHLLNPNHFPNDGPYIVKSVLEDGSIGIGQDSVVNNYQDMMKIVQNREQLYGGKWFAERFIEGREFNISLLNTSQGLQVSPIAELKYSPTRSARISIADYASKWDIASEGYEAINRSFEFSKTDEDLLKRLEKLSRDCWQQLRLTSYARVDVRVDEKNNIWVLEVNANPCLDPEAGFVAAAGEMGVSFTAILKHLIDEALEKNDAKYSLA